MLLMIDNYDSFTYNLVQYFCQLGQNVDVIRNDLVSIEEVEKKKPKFLVISPGPCTPDEAGISVDLIKRFKDEIPILGVCLGDQCLGSAFGANIVRAENVMHGKLSKVSHNEQGVFRGIKNPIKAVRYHSLVVERDSLDKDFTINSWTDGNTVMGFQHNFLPLVGFQFHPESIETEQGMNLLENYLKI